MVLGSLVTSLLLHRRPMLSDDESENELTGVVIQPARSTAPNPTGNQYGKNSTFYNNTCILSSCYFSDYIPEADGQRAEINGNEVFV